MNTKEIEAEHRAADSYVERTATRSETIASKVRRSKAFCAGITHQKQEGWCFDMDKAPDMETFALYHPRYPSGSVVLGYLSDGSSERYGPAGEWMDIHRDPLFLKPKAWRRISPPQPPKGNN